MNRRTQSSVLLIDDDRNLTKMLRELLESEGFACIEAASGDQGLVLAAEHKPDLIVLDVMMPGTNGLDTLRGIRQVADVPVLMLTALGDDDDRVAGLEAGADDYLTKPFLARELLLRVKAILKRSGVRDEAAAAETALVVGPLDIQPERQQATLNGEDLKLTNTELRILHVLAERPGAVAARDFLSRYALGRELLPQDRTLDTHVSNLRRKLERVDASGCSIVTVRGSGYRLTLSSAA